MSETFNEYYTRVSSKARRESLEQELGIVRCKDCKYMSTKGKTTRFCFCNEFEISVDETDYCAWGEKKDE